MKKIKTINSIIVFAFLALLLIACGKNNNKTRSNNTTNSNKSNTQTTRSNTGNKTTNSNITTKNKKEFTEELDFYLQPDNTYYVSAGKAKYFETIIIPELYDGKKVVKIIDEGFMDCENLKIVSIPSSVEEIGEKGFMNCSKLESVVFGKVIPKYVLSTFFCCEKLENVFYNGSIEEWCNNKFDYECANPMYYAKNFYISNQTGDIDFLNEKYEFVKHIIIPSNISIIGKYQFYGFSQIISFSLSNSITSIGTYAFSSCKNLKSISIPETISKIENATFSGCESLDNVILNDSVKTIGMSAFSGCKSIKNIDIPSSVTLIDQNAFNGCSSLETFEWPEGVNYINYGTFVGCTGLKNLIIPNTNLIISDGAFANNNIDYLWYNGSISDWCKMDFSYENPMNYSNKLCILDSEGEIEKFEKRYTIIKNLVLPADVESINSNQFSNCLQFESVCINDNITNINRRAFYGCDNIRKVIIGSNVKTINEYAFENCQKIYEIYNLSSLELNVEYNYFGDLLKNVLVIHNSLSDKSILTYENSDYLFAQVNGNGYLLEYYGSNQYLELPRQYLFGGVEFYTYSINKNAFSHYNNLVKITIPSTVNEIGTCSFEYCNELVEVVIEDGLKVISSGAFMQCSKLEEINIPSSVEFIGGSCFSYCAKITNIVIPKKITRIYSYTFNGCTSLKSVVLSAELSLIENKSFERCTNLEKVFYMISEDDAWHITYVDNVAIDRATKYYYSESQPVGEANYWHFVDDKIVIW